MAWMTAQGETGRAVWRDRTAARNRAGQRDASGQRGMGDDGGDASAGHLLVGRVRDQ
jgi:hypothetical protein